MGAVEPLYEFDAPMWIDFTALHGDEVDRFVDNWFDRNKRKFSPGNSICDKNNYKPTKKVGLGAIRITPSVARPTKTIVTASKEEIVQPQEAVTDVNNKQLDVHEQIPGNQENHEQHNATVELVPKNASPVDIPTEPPQPTSITTNAVKPVPTSVRTKVPRKAVPEPAKMSHPINPPSTRARKPISNISTARQPNISHKPLNRFNTVPVRGVPTKTPQSKQGQEPQTIETNRERIHKYTQSTSYKPREIKAPPPAKENESAHMTTKKKPKLTTPVTPEFVRRERSRKVQQQQQPSSPVSSAKPVPVRAGAAVPPKPKERTGNRPPWR